MNIDDFINDGVSSLQSGELQKAKIFFEKAIEIDKNHTGANNNLGLVHKELGDLEKAKDCFQKVINIDPSKEKAHNNLGIIFLQSGDLDNAKKSFDAGLTFIKYFGDIIPTTRQICRYVLNGRYRKRKSNLFTIEEVRQLWQRQSWSGKKSGDPLVVRGGYNCRHQWTYVNPDWYDKEGNLII